MDDALNSYSEDFIRIQNWIEEIVDRWRSLPNAEDVEKWRTEFARVTTRFDHGSLLMLHIGEARRVLWGDDIGNCDGISDENEGLRGQAILAFKDYVGRLEQAVYACEIIVRLVDVSLDSEMALWRQARLASTQTIHRMAGACRRLAEGGARTSTNISAGDALKEVTMGLGLASLAPSPYQTALGASSLILSAVTTGHPATGAFKATDYVNPPKPEIPHFHGALEVLSLLLNGSKNSVDENVTMVEDEIIRCLREACQTMTVTECLMFSPRIAPVTEMPETLRHDRELALEAAERIALASAELIGAAVDVNSFKEAGAPDVMQRHPRIGAGNGSGPYHQLGTLLFFLGLALQELGNEAYAASVNLHAVVEALDMAEAGRQELIQTTADSFAAADTGYLSYYSNEANIPLDVQVDVPEPVIPDIDRMRKGNG